MSAQVITLIDALDRAEQFVLYAARIHRALREQTAPQGLCLCHGFRVTGLQNALPAFVHFQNTLALDPERRFIAGERPSRIVEVCELELLRTIRTWQQQPGDDPEKALRFITTPTVRRIAAPAGRIFAIEMATVGMYVREIRPGICTPSTSAMSAQEMYGDNSLTAH